MPDGVGRAGALLRGDGPAPVDFFRDRADEVDEKRPRLLVVGDDGLKRAGTAYILIVGVNEYANADFNLTGKNAVLACIDEEPQIQALQPAKAI